MHQSHIPVSRQLFSLPLIPAPHPAQVSPSVDVLSKVCVCVCVCLSVCLSVNLSPEEEVCQVGGSIPLTLQLLFAKFTSASVHDLEANL